MPTSAHGLAHVVFFTLKDQTPAAQQALVAACHRCLPDHPGVVHFSAGVRGPAYQRPVNDQQFDVALVVVFDSEAAHDNYQTSTAHQQFIAEQSGNWAQVRVFDALV
ncbi:MAG: Dabb family protein [Pirellulales bacterium]|nr:Dabb family protein [Pirellulales bacterium]